MSLVKRRRASDELFRNSISFLFSSIKKPPFASLQEDFFGAKAKHTGSQLILFAARIFFVSLHFIFASFFSRVAFFHKIFEFPSQFGVSNLQSKSDNNRGSFGNWPQISSLVNFCNCEGLQKNVFIFSSKLCPPWHIFLDWNNFSAGSFFLSFGSSHFLSNRYFCICSRKFSFFTPTAKTLLRMTVILGFYWKVTVTAERV